MVPADAVIVAVDFGVRVLSGDQLKGVDALPRDRVGER
jgi:hypothetical protein